MKSPRIKFVLILFLLIGVTAQAQQQIFLVGRTIGYKHLHSGDSVRMFGFNTDLFEAPLSPGPTLVMNEGDSVELEFFNFSQGAPHTIHLHGLDVNQANALLAVNIDGAPVVYDFLEVDEIVHAYAISVHKSQGAEYPCVVIPMVTQHYMMLQRNLLYTAVTRAKKLVILVGTRKAINIAVQNNQITQRHTALDWRLRAVEK